MSALTPELHARLINELAAISGIIAAALPVIDPEEIECRLYFAEFMTHSNELIKGLLNDMSLEQKILWAKACEPLNELLFGTVDGALRVHERQALASELMMIRGRAS